jgi:hypothetical protein
VEILFPKKTISAEAPPKRRKHSVCGKHRPGGPTASNYHMTVCSCRGLFLATGVIDWNLVTHQPTAREL